jgi:hypothetical protein
MSYKTLVEIKQTDLYIKDIDEWKIVSDEELSKEVSFINSKVVDLQNTVNYLEENLGSDVVGVTEVSSTEELDSNATPGSLAILT